MKISIMSNDGMQLLRCRGSDRHELRLLFPGPGNEKVIALRFDLKTLPEYSIVDVNGGPEIEDE